MAQTASTARSAPKPASPVRRWSADLWLALRAGGAELTAGAASVPFYGASQTGAVLRYHLAPASRHDPAAYVRAVQVIGRREGDLAAGVSARILPAASVTANVEARASRRGDRVDIRPAAFVAAGLDDAVLPLGFRARGYVQAGFVGGRDATAFADGSLVAEREVVRARETGLAAGGGLWGGAQRGAARLDVGPGASMRFRLGEGSARLAVDYRFRVAGNAAPASGAALTLSAGF